MNYAAIETLLRLAGLIMIGLISANVVAAKRFGYAANLSYSATIVRQIFYVHCGYIVAIIAGLAILCLGWPELLMESGMGKVLSGYFGLFWLRRVVVQLFYYDPALRAENRFWDLFFLGVFSTLTLLGVILPMPLLFPPTFQTEVIEVCLGLFFQVTVLPECGFQELHIIILWYFYPTKSSQMIGHPLGV
jgi:hypothetical protein